LLIARFGKDAGRWQEQMDNRNGRPRVQPLEEAPA